MGNRAKDILIACICSVLGFGALSAEDQAARAKQLLAESGVRGGLIVHVGCGNGELAAALRVSDAFVVHGLDTDAKQIDAARKQLRSLGVYGPVSLAPYDGKHLPYADNTVNLIIVTKGDGVPEKELLRALVPNGVALVGERKIAKKWPDDIDEWTHFFHDASGNAVSKDRRVDWPKHLQWDGPPRWSRSHETDMSINAVVTARGRVFHFFDEGPIGIHETPEQKRRLPDKASLVARDAFNGIQLWNREVKGWGSTAWDKERWRWGKGDQLWSSPLTLPRCMVASGDCLYVTLGYRARVSELDAVTGKTLRELEGTDGADEIILSEDVLVSRVRTGPGKDAIVAVETKGGKVTWQQPYAAIVPLTLAASGSRVCFCAENQIVALDLKTGKEVWKKALQSANAKAKGKAKARPKSQRGGLVCLLLIYEDVVLYADAGSVVAFSMKDGSQLWRSKARLSFRGPPDLLVVNGQAWLGASAFGLVDVKTGKPGKQIEAGNVLTGGHHVRCHRAKATENFILYPKRGIEFIDVKSDRHMRHDWVRGMCRQGIVPANGLVYAPSHPCFCFPGVKLTGFNALVAKDSSVSPERKTPIGVVKGPAFGKVEAMGTSADDWPTYRGDNARSGSTKTKVPTKLSQTWTQKLTGKVTPPVVADGRLYMSEVETHTVHCLSAEDGKPQWQFIAGGPVDSPPTVSKGHVLFGCTDGSVYCLRASDGALVWRFNAAPYAKRIVSYGQLQSAWPVHGSVLVRDGIAYFAAGRSTYLDGGMGLYGIDVVTGKTRYETNLEGPAPDLSKPSNRAHEMDGSKNDILVSNDTSLFLTQNVFNFDLEPVPAPKIAKWGARKTDLHLVPTGGFLDDSGFDRLYWMYAERWPGLYVAPTASKAGQILVFDDKTTYGLHQFTKKFSRSPYFAPATEGCELFADDNTNEPILSKQAAARERGSMGRAQDPKWSVQIPVRARAMVLAGEHLFLAGPPDVIEADDPYGAFEGRKGGQLWAVSTADGKKIAEYKLQTPPVFDGLIAAGGRLYLVCKDGTVSCWK